MIIGGDNYTTREINFVDLFGSGLSGLGNMATKIALKPLKYEVARDNARELSIDPKELMNIKGPGEGFVRFSNEETKKVWIRPYITRKDYKDQDS